MLLIMAGVICVFLGYSSEGKTEEKSDKWAYYGKSDNGDFYYDKTSVKQVRKNIMRVSDKLIFKKENVKPSKKDNNKKMDNQITLHEFNCGTKERKLIKFVTYNKDGKILESYEKPNSSSHKIEPNTIYDILRKKICQE